MAPFKFSDSFRKACRPETCNLLDIIEETVSGFEKMAGHLTVRWAPDQPTLMHVHNHFIDVLLAVYIAKHSAFSRNMALSLERRDYLGYALNGRSIVEMAATLRHYTKNYARILRKGQIDLKELINLHYKHLHGTRFDWDNYFSGRFFEMAEHSKKEAEAKKKKGTAMAQRIKNSQINVFTCIQDWSKEAPVVSILYELFCDLVHPNMGSNLLVSSTSSDGLYFGQSNGQPSGHVVFENSLLWLMSVGYKGFSTHFTELMSMKYQPDELASFVASGAN